MFRVILFIISLILSMASNFSAYAEEGTKMLEVLAKQMSTTVDDPKLQQWINSKKDQSSINIEEQELPIVKHYTAAEGINLPSESEIQKSMQSYLNSSEVKNKISEEAISDYVKQSDEEMLKPMQSIKFVDCTMTDRELIVHSEHTDLNQVQLEQDIIFISAADLPADNLGNFDLGEILGKSVQVVAIDQGNSEESLTIQHFTHNFGITCLPTRYRVTNTSIIRDYGAKALRNYDKDIYGAGELHPQAEAILKKR